MCGKKSDHKDLAKIFYTCIFKYHVNYRILAVNENGRISNKLSLVFRPIEHFHFSYIRTASLQVKGCKF
jgi:hypothetical protein